MTKRTAPREQAQAKRCDGSVGYGRPPKEHQFKPGRSGNPKGRPRGAKSEDTIFREVIGTRVSMTVGGRVRKVNVLEAVWVKVADEALKGNAKAQALIINRSRALEATDPEQCVMPQDDEKVLQSYFRQVTAQLEAKKKEKS